MKIQGSEIEGALTQLEKATQDENIDKKVKTDILSQIQNIKTLLENHDGPDLLSEIGKWKQRILETFTPVFEEFPKLHRLPLVVYGRYGNGDLHGEIMNDIRILVDGVPLCGFAFSLNEDTKLFTEDEEYYDEVEDSFYTPSNKKQKCPTLKPVFEDIVSELDGEYLCDLFGRDDFYGVLVYLERQSNNVLEIKQIEANYIA